MMAQTIWHQSATASHWITPPFRLAPGIYQLELTGSSLQKTLMPLMVKGAD
jgi:hypothetical protein